MKGWLSPKLLSVQNGLFASSPTDIDGPLIELQYDRLSREVPLMVFVAMISTILIMVASWGPGVPLYYYTIPVLGLIGGAQQIWTWHVRNRARPALPEMRKILINSATWGGIFASSASIWTLFAILHPAFHNQTILPVFLMLGVLASSACFSSLPITATSVLIIGIWPCSFAMIWRGEPIDALMGTADLIAGYMQYRFVAEQHRQNILRLTIERDVLALANTDDLTGLLNHRAFMAELDLVAQEATPDQPYAVAMLDLDGFKRVNDTLGHQVGDRLLKVVAQRLNEQCLEGDLVGRLGGDEFGFIFRHVTGGADVERRTTAIMGSLCRSVLLDGRALPVGGSLGYATWPEHGDCPNILLATADRALYRLKRKRRLARGEEVTQVPAAIRNAR